MIVPMKKAVIIAQSKDAEAAVKKLRSLGVVHVEHIQEPKSKDISAIHEDIAIIDEAFGILSGFAHKKEGEQPHPGKHPDFRGLSRHIIDLYKRLSQLREHSRHLENSIEQYSAWGDFEPQKISFLAEKNIFVRLYQIPQSQIKGLPVNVIVKIVSISKGFANAVVVSQEKTGMPFKEIVLPKASLKDMRGRKARDAQIIRQIEEDIAGHARYMDFLLDAKRLLEKDLRFHKAVKGMGSAGGISYLAGYIPHDSAGLLSGAAKKESWGIIIDNPSGEDNVPTFIRNPKWVSLISPLFKVLEIVPGYNELDISLWFLVFFSIFFGILIGDAGYGSLFLGLTAFAHAKFGKRLKDVSMFTLFYILSSCAVIWGVLSGTFFGQEWLPRWIRPLMPALRDDKTVQTICFFLGALHLSIAHIWRAILKAPSLAALADIGWVNIIWASFYIAKTLILGEALPGFVKFFLIAGPALVILFSAPNKNILKGVGEGLGNFLLSVMNCFTDVVSYIRLFAVGLATVAVADSFNKMAMGIGFGNIFAGVATVIVLILGHALNTVLGPMSVLVHGVRLNVLEFCGHADVKWSGFSYKPLKEE